MISRRVSGGRLAWYVALFAIVAAIALAIAVPACAYADENTVKDDIEFDGASGFSGSLPMMGNDYVWFGKDLALQGETVKNDFIAAGETIDFGKGTVAGDIRAAARTITIAETSVTENMSLAAETVTMSDVKAQAIVATGATVTFSGSCTALTAYGNEVVINGTVDGDVVVGANHVELGPNAKIAGTLHVEASESPTVESGASVGDIDFTQSEKTPSEEEVGSAVAVFSSVFAVIFAIVGILATLLIAICSEWLFSRHTEAAARMIKERTGATIGTGIVGMVVAPIAIIVLCMLIITLPIAGALVLALLAMALVASGFAGASIFKLAFPNMGRYKCALAGGAIMAVAGAIPFLGGIVRAAAFAYLLAYVLQSIHLGMYGKRTAAQAQAPVATEAVPQPSQTPQAS